MMNKQALTLTASLAVILSGCGGQQVAPKPGAQAGGVKTQAACGTTNVALNKPSLASSNETNDTLAPKAFDGNGGTRWSSAFSDPQWIQVNLGSVQQICGVTLQWETARAATFQIEVSNDGTTFAPATGILSGTDGTQTVSLSASGQYVRMKGLTRNTGYGYSLFEFQVFTGAGTTPATGSVCFFTDINYGGQSFCDGGDSSWVGQARNDVISSVKVNSGYQVTLFDDINFGGRSLKLSADTPNLVNLNFNDLTSSYQIAQGGGATLPTSDNPDFGPNVKIYDPGTPTTTIQADLDAAFNDQLRNPASQFGDQRHVFLFKPGAYNVYANLGFYTTLAGLGQNPDDVTITNNFNVDSGWVYGDEKNATQNFWRSVENLSVAPQGGTTRWAVSQAAPMRRVHIKGALTMGPSNQDYGQGYSSGGYIADSKVDGQVSSGSQQQFYLRNSTLGSWAGGNWNMVFSGVQGAPPADNSHTVLGTTPVTREKPYLYVDGSGKYRVFVPSLRTNSAGITWPNTPGTSLPLSQFYVARPGVTADTLNAALGQGLNLFFTPGVYSLDKTVNVTRPGTVVYGIGFPTLVPTAGQTAMSVADLSGVKVSGLLFDAGANTSPTLLTVGQSGVHADHSGDPTLIQDVYFRVGGPRAGKVTTAFAVNSDNTVVDHTWVWRADHGSAPTGWTVNTSDTGFLVNGNNVLATGLFVEHFQKYEVLWNGQGGKTIFFQNEMPYDPPNQAAWNSPTGLGYASYKVADNVTSNELWGGGAYCFFQANPSIVASRGFEVPNTPGVKLHNVFTVSLGDVGTIQHVVNNTGGQVPNPAGNTVPQYVPNFP